MVDAFFLEVPKEEPATSLGRGFRRRIKRPYFHRAVEMKQPPNDRANLFE